MKKEIKSIVAVSLSLLISCVSTGCVPQTRPTSYNPSEYSSVASEIMDSMQNGAHGLDSDLPFYSDINGYVDNGIYCNENLMFSIDIPEDWSVFSLEEMEAYGVPESTQRLVYDIERDHGIGSRDEIYDFMCADSNGHRISVLLIYRSYNPPSDFLESTYINHDILRISRIELEADPTATRVARDDATLTEINGQQVYVVNWTIYHEDGSETYRTEIIDFFPPCTRILAIEYNSPAELDNYLSLISYQADNMYPVAEDTLVQD